MNWWILGFAVVYGTASGVLISEIGYRKRKRGIAAAKRRHPAGRDLP